MRQQQHTAQQAHCVRLSLQPAGCLLLSRPWKWQNMESKKGGFKILSEICESVYRCLVYHTKMGDLCSFLPEIPTQCSSRAILVSAWNCSGRICFSPPVLSFLTLLLGQSNFLLAWHNSWRGTDLCCPPGHKHTQEWAVQDLSHSRNSTGKELIALWLWSLYQHITSCDRLAMATRSSPAS